MRSRTTQSALLAAGAAAGAVAATWIGKRRLRAVKNADETLERDDELIEPESAELPVGRSADPEIDGSLSRHLLPQDETTGGALLGDIESSSDAVTDASLDEIWNALPGFAEGEQTEGYDAVTPEDLGSVWLERATQTTHEHPPHGSDPSDTPSLESLAISEASIASSHSLDDDDDDIDDDALDLDDTEEK